MINKESFSIQLAKKEGEWMVKTLEKLSVYNLKTRTFQEIKLDFEQDFQDFEIFWYSKPLFTLRDFGLLVVL